MSVVEGGRVGSHHTHMMLSPFQKRHLRVLAPDRLALAEERGYAAVVWGLALVWEPAKVLAYSGTPPSCAQQSSERCRSDTSGDPSHHTHGRRVHMLDHR